MNHRACTSTPFFHICSTIRPLSFHFRVADLQGSIDVTMNAYGVIGKAKTPLDETTMSMKWEVFGWPQKVTVFVKISSRVVMLTFFNEVRRRQGRKCAERLGHFIANTHYIDQTFRVSIGRAAACMMVEEMESTRKSQTAAIHQKKARRVVSLPAVHMKYQTTFRNM